MHCRLMKESSVLAKQYRIDCGLESSKQKVVKVEKTPTKTVVKEEIDVIIPKEEKEYNRDDLKAILEKNEVKYFKWAKTEKLLEICIKNKLI